MHMVRVEVKRAFVVFVLNDQSTETRNSSELLMPTEKFLSLGDLG